MALINSSQIQYPLSGTFSGSFSGDGSGLTNLSVSGDKISSGSITASVSPIGNLFLIKSASTELMTIISGTTTITNDIFLIKNISFVIVVVPDIIVINSVLADLIKNKFPIGLTLAVILPDDILSPLTDKLVKPLPSPENDPLKVPDRGYCICELLINAISY